MGPPAAGADFSDAPFLVDNGTPAGDIAVEERDYLYLESLVAAASVTDAPYHPPDGIVAPPAPALRVTLLLDPGTPAERRPSQRRSAGLSEDVNEGSREVDITGGGGRSGAARALLWAPPRGGGTARGRGTLHGSRVVLSRDSADSGWTYGSFPVPDGRGQSYDTRLPVPDGRRPSYDTAEHILPCHPPPIDTTSHVVRDCPGACDAPLQPVSIARESCDTPPA